MSHPSIAIGGFRTVRPADLESPSPATALPVADAREPAPPSGAPHLPAFDPLAPRQRGYVVPPRPAIILAPQEGNPWAGLLNDDLGIRIDEYAQRDTAQLKAFFPPRYARIVAQHVDRMFEEGWADQLNPVGLFHGHLLLQRELPEGFDSLDALIDHTELFLYHTAENTGRWRAQSDRPLAERTPRSIIGRRDGTAFPAIEMMPDGFSSVGYDGFGTLGFDDIEETDPQRFHQQERGNEPPLQSNDHTWDVSLQFYIRPDPNGRFTVEGQRYDIYVKGEPDETGCGGCPVCARSCE